MLNITRTKTGDGELIEEKLENIFKRRRSSLLVLPSVCRQVLDLVRSTGGCLLGGGAAIELYTGDIYKIKDWDIFSRSIKVVELLCRRLTNLGFVSTRFTEWGQTFEKSGVVVQVITKYYADGPRHLFNKFDLSACYFATDGVHLYYTKESAYDAVNKTISSIRSKNPIISIKRIARYGQKGYMPTTKAIKDVMGSDFDDFDDEEEYES